MESIMSTTLSPEDLAGLIDAAVNKAVANSPHKKQTTIPITRQVLMERLGITEGTVLKCERQGSIPVIRIGGSVRYDYEAVLESLKQTNSLKRKRKS